MLLLTEFALQTAVASISTLVSSATPPNPVTFNFADMILRDLHKLTAALQFFRFIHATLIIMLRGVPVNAAHTKPSMRNKLSSLLLATRTRNACPLAVNNFRISLSPSLKVENTGMKVATLRSGKCKLEIG